MACVDAVEDSIRRFAVRHYRYDPERRERRHVVVAAFADRGAFERFLRRTQRDLEPRRDQNPGFDPKKYASGITYEPHHRMRAANGRLIRRAMAHGVPLGDWVDQLELSSDTWVIRFETGDAGGSRRTPLDVDAWWRRGRGRRASAPEARLD